MAGAVLEPGSRLWCWAVAAFIDLLGTWSAHPMPGRVTRTERLPFDAEHMLERIRLGSFVALVCLWVVYFGRAEQVVVRHTASTEDPIRSVHLGINVIYGVVSGLVTLAAELEIVLAHAHDGRSGAAGVLVLIGPLVYLLSQATTSESKPAPAGSRRSSEPPSSALRLR